MAPLFEKEDDEQEKWECRWEWDDVIGNLNVNRNEAEGADKNNQV